MEQYPGQNTEFFIIINGTTIGPIVGLRSLMDYPLVVDTPVWYEGLDDWKPMAVAPLTAPIFADSNFVKNLMEDVRPQSGTAHPYTLGNTTDSSSKERTSVFVTERKPRSYLGLAIVMTVLCNIIAGIVAIIYSIKVNNKYLRGDIEGAKRCSESAQWWIAISFTVGLILMVAKLFTGNIF